MFRLQTRNCFTFDNFNLFSWYGVWVYFRQDFGFNPFRNYQMSLEYEDMQKVQAKYLIQPFRSFGEILVVQNYVLTW